MDLKLSKLDYFTLQVLVGLYELKSGTCLAAKLDVAQPKVSRALSTIREVFDDEMFVRKQYGFEPNELAAKIYPIAKVVIDAYLQVQRASQDNLEQKKTINIATLDYNTNFLHQSVLEVSKKLGITSVINMVPWNDDIQKQITSGKVDYAITVNPPENNLLRTELLAEVKRFYIIARKGHPIFDKSFGYADLISNSFVLINYARIGLKKRAIELYVEKHGGEMDVVLKTNNLHYALDYLVNNDSICIAATESILEHIITREGLQYQDTTEFWVTQVIPSLDLSAQKSVQYLQGRLEGDTTFFNELVITMKQRLEYLQKTVCNHNQNN
ncbi:LysR family transcriptional regulator [Shewanella eurypsychrophilus]|uniref:LysR family transcriptional regulator n=1 Tax=Shewanella eurypsychrophilus TaxID=2593656 RepID=A0ABX6V1M9_9GAMM|nr:MULTISPECIES: LysR family transcriptional regulator [Shewanella]QFU21238.1 hypothetical protein FS418_04720 [Shewanella sp. YLB-09]QPG56529.1 LysR family transcriptional regulator [Shewanella eurypsychrophilus]